MWEKDLAGSVKMKEASAGTLVGTVMTGQPVGMIPKS